MNSSLQEFSFNYSQTLLIYGFNIYRAFLPTRLVGFLMNSLIIKGYKRRERTIVAMPNLIGII